MIWSLNETLPREEIEQIQLKRLKKQVKKCYKKSPFYRKKMKEMGVKPEDIQTLDDIALLPFTTKDDMRDNYPFGLFVEPKEKIIRYHATSGTTGNPTVVGYTKKDMEVWKECIARLVTSAGVTYHDTAHVSFGYGLFTGGFGLHQGLEKVGAGVVPMSSGNTRRQLKLMKDFGATVLIGTPSYALRLAETAREMGMDPAKELNLRVGCFGGEGSTESMRNKINEAFGMFATENWGMCELMGPGVAGECQELCGMHISEDHFLVEVIDPATGKRLPAGEKGELVVTPLTKEAVPLLRYRTKDISALHYEPCHCGRTTARIEKIDGRTDDMMVISGVNVFPSQIEEVLYNMPGIGDTYQIIVKKENHLDKIEINAEVTDPSVLDSITALTNLQRELGERMHTTLAIHPKINLVEAKSLKRFEGKAKRVFDMRGEEEE